MSDRTAAFERAAQARAAIEGVVDAVQSGEIDLQQAFDRADADVLVGRCFAVKVFEVVPGIGKVRARRTMHEMRLAEDIWLADVPADKRTDVIAAFARSA